MADYKLPIITGTSLSAGDILRWGGAAWANYADSAYQAQGAVLDDFNTLGAPASDGQFIVATGAGAFAYESTTVARTSLGVGEADTPTFGGIVVANNGTIGQAAGPLITFDDTNNFLEITGCKVGIGTATPESPLTVLSVTHPQLRFGYDANNYITWGHAAHFKLTDAVGNTFRFERNGILQMKLGAAGAMFLKEQAAADADLEAYGQIWIKTATPNELWFTDDAGTDHQIAFV